MNVSELKPCPFCGGTPVKHRSSGDERDGYADRVTYSCQSCGCSRGASGDSSKGGYADNSKVEAEALAKWNTRVSPATTCPGHGRSECVSCCWPKGEVDEFKAAGSLLRARAQLKESDRLRDAMEVAINTLVYCYDKQPGNFAAALTEAARLADESRSATL